MKTIYILLFALFFANTLFAQDGPMNGLNVNDKAPNFELKDQNGKLVNLSNELKNGSVILVFYRGQWCPYCTKQLTNLQDSMNMITNKGAQVIAITPEQKMNVDKTIAKTKADFTIISDQNLELLNAYQVSFGLDSATSTKYKTFGVNLEESNGNNGNALPVPAVYVIGKDGKINYRYFNRDYKKRPTVKELLTYL